MTARRTITRPVTVAGVGLHLGRDCALTFEPASAGSGVRFCRTDLAGRPETHAHVSTAIAAERRTQLGTGDGALHTVEHVLAAVAGLQIDDVVIAMDAAEPPIMDGSAEPFRLALVQAGPRSHGGMADVLRLKEVVRVVDGESVYVAHPAESLELEVLIDFPHPRIGAQQGRYRVTPETFSRELSLARTFGMLSWVEGLRAKGLIQGATTENTIVLDEHDVVGTTLRWPDEFVRHKAMDLVGDLALAGMRVAARITATRPSHRGTVTLVREMLAHALPQQSEARVLLGIEDIMKILPHRYPFLLVDRIVEMEPGKKIAGIKNVSANEPFFQGHFPGEPVMPGVLILEALAQVSCVLVLKDLNLPGCISYFTGADEVVFRNKVVPGDQLRLEAEVEKLRIPFGRMKVRATVDGKVACEAIVKFMIQKPA